MCLDAADPNTTVKVDEIVGGWGARHRMNRLGIHVGDKIIVKRSGIMRGPILIQVHGMDVALGRGMARKIIVKTI